MFDTAVSTMPDFTKMTLDQAKREFNDWSNSTWDFTKKLVSFQHSVGEATSVKRIQQIAIGAAASGLLMKAKALK